MIAAGIDVGSISAETVILKAGKVLVYNILPTGANSRTAGEKSFNEALERARIKREDVKYIIATGYGRISIPFADKQVTEISCHGRGAHFINKKIRTVIDIGGQDSKVIRVDANGKSTDFVMNDKCAAGTGRFLEVMARSLEIPLEEMGKISLKAKGSATISSTCTVFAESEIVSLVAEGLPIENISSGIHQAIANKIGSLAARVGIEEVVALTGGVAKNVGVRKALEDKLGIKLFIPDEPQIIGALGAALIAQDLASS
ncbi:MAG: acyl-CoA dehydratase activase [Actinobacteria bacterium]|nr:acyl-CoA dehydratase activase [Actinomycetota bacterium]